MIISNISGLDEFCARDVFGTRISALAKTYGSMNCARFAVQQSDEKITAAVGIVDGAATISCAEDADFEELFQYLKFVGADSLLCSRQVRNKIDFPFAKSGSVVEFCSLCDDTPSIPIISSGSESFRYAYIFELLCQCGFALGQYDSWLADLSLRTRRGAAETVCFAEEGKVLSTVSALFVTDSAVLLGAVATSPEARGRGIAGALVGSMCKKYSQKRIELLCEQHRLSFYEKIGFTKTGEWTQ